MGTDCKSAAFSFGGSNPPGPTKSSGIQWVPELLFYLPNKRGCKGGFEQHRPAEQSDGEKSPCGAFLDARLATSTRAHQELRYPMGIGVSVLSATQKGLQGWIRTASTRRTVRRGKKPLRGFFRCAARDIHPRPPNKKNPNLFPIGEGFGFFVFFGYDRNSHI